MAFYFEDIDDLIVNFLRKLVGEWYMSYVVKDSVLEIGKQLENAKESYTSIHKNKHRVDYAKNCDLLFLKKGKVSLYKMDSHLLSMTITAPAIIGLSELYNNVPYHYLRCNNDCTFAIINKKEAIILFDNKGLWNEAFKVLTWYQGLYLQRDRIMSHSTISHIVNEHLKCLWELSEDERKKTSVYTYIMSRNHISRSSIHKVLQEKIKNNSVVIDYGKLSFYKEV